MTKAADVSEKPEKEVVTTAGSVPKAAVGLAEAMAEHLQKLADAPRKWSEPIRTSFDGDGVEPPRPGY